MFLLGRRVKTFAPKKITRGDRDILYFDDQLTLSPV